MRKLFTTWMLIAAMIGGAVGIGAHPGEGSCPLNNLPDCCKKARSSSKVPAVSMARLCCNLNCSEPGSSGASFSTNLSSQQGSSPLPALVPRPVVFGAVDLNSHHRNCHPSASNPKYIQHLALLI